MNEPPPNYRRTWLIIAGAAFCCLAIGYACWPHPNTSARRQVRNVLLATSKPTEQQLSELGEFVQIGDHIDDVRGRLSPSPTDDKKGVKRPTEWSLGLRGVNLELAIESDGRVVGIGRHINGIDDGVIWLAPPQWHSPDSRAN